MATKIGQVLVLAAAVSVVLGPALIVTVRRGRKVTNASVGPGKVVDADPRALARQAKVDLDTYSLARVISSEATDLLAEKVAVGWVTKNKAALRRRSITALVTSGRRGKGKYAAQNTGGRFVSTRLDPRTEDIEIATGVISGRVPDTTGGAIGFLHPVAQDRLLAEGRPGYTRGSQATIDKWRASGLIPAAADGVSPADFLVFRRAA